MTTTKILLQEDDVLKLVLEFLSGRKLYKSARTLEKETNVVNCPYSDSITFIRELVLDGEWKALEEFAQPLEDIHDFDCRKFHFLVTRQNFFEILFEKCEGNIRDEHILRDQLMSCLNLLEKYCSRKDEYNKLYWYLSLPSLRDEPEFLAWNIDLSRIALFEELLVLLKPFIPLEEQNSSRNNVALEDRLLGLISKGLLYENCIEFCQKQATHKTNASDFSLTNIRADLFRIQSPKSTGNFYSWLHNLAPESFVTPFEEVSIDVFVEKQKPNLTRPDMKNNSLTRSLTIESRRATESLYREHQQLQREEGKRLSDGRQPRHPGQLDVNGRDVSQSWADFNFDRKSVLTNNRDDYLDNKLPTKESPDDCDGLEVQSKKTNLTNSQDVYLDNKSPPRDDSGGMVVQSPRKMRKNQQEVVLKRLEEHKKKQQELHQQLAEMTAGLAMEDDQDTRKAIDNERPNNINGVIPAEITSQKSFDVLRKSKESLSFLNKASETPKASASSTAPSTRPQRFSIPEEDHREINDTSKSSSVEPKTPINTCVPPGLVKLADGSGTFNTSTPKSHRQSFMTPPPPASPVTLEHEASLNKRDFQQKRVIMKDPESEVDVFNQTPKRTTSTARQSVVRSLVNDIYIEEKQKPVPRTDETFAIKRMEPVNTATREIKFQKVAVLADTQAIRSVAFHPNGNYFAVGTNSKSLKVCSFRDSGLNPARNEIPQQPEVVFKKTPIHKGSVYCIAFSPTGNIIATGSNDKLIKLLRFGEAGVQSLQDEMELAIHSATVRDLTFFKTAASPPILASGGAGGGLIYLSDCTTGQTVSSLQGHSGNIMTVFAGSHENLLCSGSADKSVRLWDLRVPKCIDVVSSSSCVASVCFNYGTGPIHLASAHENGQCVIYDISARKAISTFQPHKMDCRTIRYSPDSKYILTGSYDASIAVTDIRYNLDSRILLNTRTVARHSDKVIQCRWHPSLYTFLSSSADKTVAIWKLEGR